MLKSKKKQAQEELMKTHVLNLSEIRDAEKKDKRERRRKIPKAFFIIGLFLIIVGILISIIIPYLHKKNKEDTKIKKDKSKLTCISNLKNNYYSVNVHTETTYIFSNDRLYESTSKVSSTVRNEKNYILKLHEDLNANTGYIQDQYSNPQNGITYKISELNKEELYLEFTIKYNYFKDVTYQSVANKYSNVPILNNTFDYEKVKEEAEKLGALCN